MPLRLALAVLVAACSANDDVPAPLISNVTPDQAIAGQVVTVNGSYFCQRPAGTTDDPNCNVAGTVHFGAAPGTPTDWQDTAILVEVPAEVSGVANVEVVAGGKTSNTVAFTIE